MTTLIGKYILGFKFESRYDNNRLVGVIFVPSMVDCIGKVGKIVDVVGNRATVFFAHNGKTWNYPLELVIQAVDRYYAPAPALGDQIAHRYPRVMEVCDRPDFIDSVKRVVILEKKGVYLTWAYAATLEEAEDTLATTTWKYAREIPPATIELTMDEIADKFGVDVNNLKIKK